MQTHAYLGISTWCPNSPALFVKHHSEILHCSPGSIGRFFGSEPQEGAAYPSVAPGWQDRHELYPDQAPHLSGTALRRITSKAPGAVRILGRELRGFAE